MPPLQEILRLLTQPIEFASKNQSAHLSSIQNLGPFVTRQVLTALTEKIFVPAIEADLLALRQLFSDYHNGLSFQERKRRLSDAAEILKRLKGYQDESVQRSDPPSAVSRPQGIMFKKKPEKETIHRDLWNLPIQYAKGVGPKRAALMERIGVRTVEDALWMLPWRYEDRSHVTPIGLVKPKSRVTICGVVTGAKLTRTARRGMTIFEVGMEDESGTVSCIFFNQPYLADLIKTGMNMMMNGVASEGKFKGRRVQLDSPQYEILGEREETPLHVGRIVPIYHETKGLTSRQLRTIVKGLLDSYLLSVEEVLPPALIDRQRLLTLRKAIPEVHFPEQQADPEALERGKTSAHERLAFEELFLLELALALRQRTIKEEQKGIAFNGNHSLGQRLRGSLPFQLTEAQERVLEEIVGDMGCETPMNRLVQGDVGCGKTVVALYAMVLACGSGYQAALMVPTEILAEQHYLNIRQTLVPLGLKVGLLKSGLKKAQRVSLMEQIKTGQVNVLIGTHALIQKDVEFQKLGLVVIDEQHKFGVLQRKQLLEKGFTPDILVLTATPIPRTLAMTVYGDLDVSTIDELPPGRKPVETSICTESQRKKAYRLAKREIDAGRQAYIVYPLVEESEKVDLRAVLEGAEQLQAEEFQSYRIGVLHGKMKTEEKEAVMAAFKSGNVDILVATTVIEVGVDVPNASVMLVEHAERFGLAQLHQLRGRVGRGAEQSYCLLMTSGRSRKTPSADEPQNPGLWKNLPIVQKPLTQAKQRLEALVRTNDGFLIAEEDLRIRGPGEFFGVRQSGIPVFRVANLMRDVQLLERARQEAFALIEHDPQLSRPEHRLLQKATLRRWKSKLDLGSVS